MEVVTGGAGFIGAHLVRRLLGDGRAVRVLDNFSTGTRDRLAGLDGDLEIVEGDVRDPVAVRRALAGASRVHHLAAVPSVPRSIADPRTTVEVNVMGTLNVLDAARDAGCERVVVSSSSSVYGDTPGLPNVESMAPSPISPYAASKLAAEALCRSFHRAYGLETVALRYFNVFGPGQDPDSPYAAVVPRFVSALREGRPATIFGDGRQSRDFTFVANVVDAHLLATTASDAPGLALNIACGRSVSLLDVLAVVAGLLGVEAEARHEPPRPGDVRDSLADISLAARVLGYAPRVDLERGLALTVLPDART